MVVCEYCHSMLLRQADSTFVDNGKAAVALEDYSLIQIGTTGRYQNRGFTAIGRFQKEYDRGGWNEWYLLFDDGSDGWLSDSGGQYTITQLKEENYSQAPPYLETIPGSTAVRYANQDFVASDVRSAKNLGTKAQGELPFPLEKDRTTYAADYRAGKYFLTLDYTDCPPINDTGAGRDRPLDLGDSGNSSRKAEGSNNSSSVKQALCSQPELYYGQGVTLEDLQCQLLRSEDQIRESAGKLRGQANALQCPMCGASLVWYPGVAHHLVCPSCHADVNVSADKAHLLGVHTMREAQARAANLKLGDQARIGGKLWTVIGLMRCQELEADGSTHLKKSYASYTPHLEDRPMVLVEGSTWYEYLLYNPAQGFRWIVETKEGWELVTELSSWPSREQRGGSVRLSGRTFGKQWEYGSKVIYAAGAFTWHIQPSDITYISDYQGASKNNEDKLTCERYENEITWSRSRSVTAQDIATWFRRPELAEIGKTGFDDESKHVFSRRVALIFTIGLLLINLPSIARLGFEDYIVSMFCGCILIWLPWLRQSSTSDED